MAPTEQTRPVSERLAEEVRTGEHGGRAVIEDAVSGVAAAGAGGFGLLIGVDPGAGAQTLREAGADIVVRDLAELVTP